LRADKAAETRLGDGELLEEKMRELRVRIGSLIWALSVGRASDIKIGGEV
jgi:hypothetical protein